MPREGLITTLALRSQLVSSCECSWSAMWRGPWWARPSRQPAQSLAVLGEGSTDVQYRWWPQGAQLLRAELDVRASGAVPCVQPPVTAELCCKLLHQLFSEENIHSNLFLFFLTVGLWKRQSRVCHPCSSIPGQCRVMADAATHSRHWQPPLGTSLWHTTALCSPVGEAHLSHTLVKNAEVGAL